MWRKQGRALHDPAFPVMPEQGRGARSRLSGKYTRTLKSNRFSFKCHPCHFLTGCLSAKLPTFLSLSFIIRTYVVASVLSSPYAFICIKLASTVLGWTSYPGNIGPFPSPHSVKQPGSFYWTPLPWLTFLLSPECFTSLPVATLNLPDLQGSSWLSQNPS